MASRISIRVEDEERLNPLDPDCPLQFNTDMFWPSFSFFYPFLQSEVLSYLISEMVLGVGSPVTWDVAAVLSPGWLLPLSINPPSVVLA